ncbi:hypothetical protein AgCh_018574 [Apium graveolens]
MQVVLLTDGMDTHPYRLNWPKSTVVFDISLETVFKRAAQKLEAQNEPSINNIQNIQAEKAITGLLDGSGEYTLVYEDNEGDIMLVGDVPWQ